MKTLSEKELNEIASKDRTWSFKIARDVQSALVVLNSEDDWDYISTNEDRAKFAPKLKTDEYFDNLLQMWLPIKVGTHFSPGDKYRRRKKPVVGGEWCTDNQPFPFIAMCADGRKTLVQNITDLNNLEHACNFMFPITLPPPPTPERSKCELAYESHPDMDKINFFDFKAGYEAAKVGGEK